MKKSRFTEEQVIGILKQHEAGVKTADLCREHGISAATFYQWKSKFGGMDVSEAQRLRALEDENRRLKMLVAELSLGGEALKAVIRKTAGACRPERGCCVRLGRVLERAIAERGRPENVRSDNGPEFTSRRMIGWAEDWKVGLVHIQPGKPMQNGHVESFHGRLRDECLNTSWFRTLNDVRETLANWRREYNEERPHSSLDYRTPEQFRHKAGYADVESKVRFPHPHSLDDGDENKISKQNQNRETPVISGLEKGATLEPAVTLVKSIVDWLFLDARRGKYEARQREVHLSAG